MSRARRSTDGARVILVGLGNIGSHLLGLVARLPGVGELVLVDRDVYETGNLPGQHIEARDVGRPKVLAQAKRARRTNPALCVTARHADLADLPAGIFAGAVVVSGLDSIGARQLLHERTWRAGTPLIDAGVRPDRMLARVSIHRASENGPCLECGWGAEDYERIMVVHPCGAGLADASPTAGPAALGALAASLAAIEASRELAGLGRPGGWSLVVDANAGRSWTAQDLRNPACRFDHRAVRPRQLSTPPGRITLSRLLRLAGGSASDDAPVAELAVVGSPLSLAMVCERCLRSVPGLQLLVAAQADSRVCPDCGGRLVPGGRHARDRARIDELPHGSLALPLSRIGIRPGELLRVFVGVVETVFRLPDRKERPLPGADREGAE